MDDTSEQPHDESTPSLLPKGCSGRFLAIMLGAFLAMLTLLAYLFFTAGPRLGEVDQTRLDKAQQLWKRNGPANYDIEVAVTGPRAAVYRVEIREGNAVTAMRDGSPLKDARTLGTWSVPGMFDTMQSDVDHASEPIQINARESHFVSPRAEFHPQYGYPQRYRRIEWGSDMEVGWEVTEFLLVD